MSPTPPVAATGKLSKALEWHGRADRQLLQWADHLLERLDRQIAASRAPDLVALAEELRSYPGVGGRSPQPDDVATRLYVALVLRHGGGELTLFSTIATFGTALDITVAELAIESFFPADEATSAALAAAAS